MRHALIAGRLAGILPRQTAGEAPGGMLLLKNKKADRVGIKAGGKATFKPTSLGSQLYSQQVK